MALFVAGAIGELHAQNVDEPAVGSEVLDSGGGIPGVPGDLPVYQDLANRPLIGDRLRGSQQHGDAA